MFLISGIIKKLNLDVYKQLNCASGRLVISNISKM